MKYFAYGSNLNESDWNERIAHPWAAVLEPREPAELLDHAPVYHYYSRGRGGGALDVSSQRGHSTPGMLFEVVGDLQVLDRKEGHPRFYHREPVYVQTTAGEIQQALTYVVNAERVIEDCIAPTEDYRGVVREGLSRFGQSLSAHESAADGIATAGVIDAVFVYGTLRVGEARAAQMHIDRRGEWLPAQARGVLYDLGSFPALTHGDGRVHGELHRFGSIARALERLDRIEGHASIGDPRNLYDRVLIDVETSAGLVRAWTYVMRDCAGAPPIESGDWTKR